MPLVNELTPSGQRLTAVYSLFGEKEEAWEKARDICIEQTIEFPQDLVEAPMIRDTIFGKIEHFQRVGDRKYEAVISFAIEISGMELPQLLNVLFGNISMKLGIRLESFELPDILSKVFEGPCCGRRGLRELLGVPKRPLIATALKPMGLSPRQLADLAYKLILGGIDILKDDHGLADQAFCPFKERIKYCSEAVERANRETGFKSIYMPNITGPASAITKQAKYVKKNGAGGLLISPGLTGFDIMNQLAADKGLRLPIMCHPSFLGSYVLNPTAGFSHAVLFGQIARLAGADVTVYPNFGGRFPFTKDECLSIAEATGRPMASIAPIFPSPSGGMKLERIGEVIDVYGKEVVILIGGDLHCRGSDLVENTRFFRKRVEKL